MRCIIGLVCQLFKQALNCNFSGQSWFWPSQQFKWCLPRICPQAEPWLFIIYTSDLPPAVKHSGCSLFADSTLTYAKSCRPHDLNRHAALFRITLLVSITGQLRWNITFNTVKSSQMFVQRKRHILLVTNTPMSLDGTPICLHETVQHCGVQLSANLPTVVKIHFVAVEVSSPKACNCQAHCLSLYTQFTLVFVAHSALSSCAFVWSMRALGLTIV